MVIDSGNGHRGELFAEDMENIQFEIHHDRVVAVVAKQLGLEPAQVELTPLTADETSACMVKVRTDLATANKIDRKLKRLMGEDAEQPEE